MSGMSLPDALEHYKAARQHVHEAMDARDPARLATALQVESMWERIVDHKRVQTADRITYAVMTELKLGMSPMGPGPRSMCVIDNIGTP